jgi:hypothetical protein
VSDLVGEKLNASFVGAALDGLGLDAAFRTLVPILHEARGGRYALVLDRAARSPAELAAALDAALRASPLYDSARSLGQLAAPTVNVVPDAAERFGLYYAERGARWGGVKQSALVRDAEHGRGLARSLGL